MTTDYSDVNDEKELLESASPEVRDVMRRVAQVENDKISQEKPRLKEDILKIIKEVINENTIDSII